MSSTLSEVKTSWVDRALSLVMLLSIGLLMIALFQADTQINAQTLSFLLRLLMTMSTIMWAGPWILTRLTDYFTFLFTNIPLLIG